MNAQQRFLQFSENFRQTPEWAAMRNTRENSPWHREANVAIHTAMVMRWYEENYASNRSDTQYILTMTACMFHDVGKPPAQVTKHSAERGEYRSYAGHEQLSARMWVDYALRNKDQVLGDESLLRLSMSDVANIALMLEHHVPFGIKNQNKRKALKQAFFARMGEAGHRAWLDLLMSDQHGRISDGQAEKLAEVDRWMLEWDQV